MTDPHTTPDPLRLEIQIACDIATGTIPTDPGAVARSVRAAHRDANARGRIRSEWYRLVYRSGSWQYFAFERMPALGEGASNRHVTLHGDVYAGELLAQHDRGGPVTAVYLVHDRVVDEDGNTMTIRRCDHTRTRDGLLITLPTGAHVTLPDPRR